MTNSLIEKYCVRIKSNKSVGSGVLLAGRDTFYVFTAAHCLGKEKPQLQEIVVEKQKDYASDFACIEVIGITVYDLEHDYALIEIDLPEEERLLCNYKMGSGILGEDGVRFCGYQGVNLTQFRPYNGRVLTASNESAKFKITLDQDTFDQAGEDGAYLAKGLSGSGVFIIRHNSPFLIGVLKSVVTEKAWNDDIECCSVQHLEKYVDEYVDLSDFDNLIQWNENLEKNRTEREIEAFKSEASDFFDKLYGKNQVLYPEAGKADKVTAKQIRKFLAMRDNVKTLENDYPFLYSKFKDIVKRFVDTVEDEYSRNVEKSSEALDLKIQLQEELKNAFELLPAYTNIDLSDFQVIEWLGMCTLNFTKND